jgi:small-conductance mechanosensitive channel
MIEKIFNSLMIPEDFHNPVIILLWIIVIAVISWFIKKQISKTHLGNDVQYKAKKAITFGTYSVILLVIVIIYSSKLGGLTVALGVAGAGIAFALQEVIASFAGWLALLFGNFYKPGDRVQLGGIKGDVIDIGILRTTLMETGQWVDGDLYNGRIVRIANSYVFKEPVFNYSSDFPFLWDEIKIPVRFGSDHEKARAIFYNVVIKVTEDFAKEATTTWATMTNKYRVENAKTDPIVTLVVNDNWIEFTIRYVVDYKRRRITKDQLFTAILNELQQTKESVTLASATFEVTSLPPLSINLTKE